MSNPNDPIYPVYDIPSDGANPYLACVGLTARQYAAIHLRVADSGEEWLDEVIRKANAQELPAQMRIQDVIPKGGIVRSGIKAEGGAAGMSDDWKAKVERMREIVKVITSPLPDGQDWSRRIANEMTMRIPAEPNRDADLVLSWAADEIERLRDEATNATLRLQIEQENTRMLENLLEKERRRMAAERQLRELGETRAAIRVMRLADLLRRAYDDICDSPDALATTDEIAKQRSLIVAIEAELAAIERDQGEQG